jgi:type I restriction enzyme S subunit
MANKQLGDVCEFINGGAWKETEYSDSGIHVVKVTNIVAGEIVKRQDDSFLPDSKYDRYQTHELREGDIVVATVGSHPTQPGSVVGRTTRVNRTFAGSFLNQNAVCLRFPEGGEVCSEYFAYLTKTVLFKHHIESRAKGSANQVRMGIGELKKFGHSFPTLSVQRKIAAVLRAYDDLIENNKRRITLLENMAEEIYREWFVRFRFPGWQEAEFEKGYPASWRALKFDEFCKLKRGYDLPDAKVMDGSYPVLASTSVKTFHSEYKVKSPVITTGRSGSLGTVLFKRENCWPLNTTLYVQNFKGNSPFLVYFTLKNMPLETFNSGAGVPSLNRNHLAGLRVVVPDETAQREFDEVVEPIFRQVDILQEQSEQLLRTKAQLLLRLISGKLSVENLDIQFPPSMQSDESDSSDEAAA